jgi:hypothetical protein
MTDASSLDLDAKCAQLEAHIARLEMRMLEGLRKADHAAEVALGAIETVKHQQSAAEHAHAQTAELLAAMRKLLAMTESLAQAALAKVHG